MTRRALVPWALVLVAALAYPLAVLAGGAPRFPGRGECVHPARADGDLQIVFGRSERAADADALLERVLAAGFKGSEEAPDGCGLIAVRVRGIPTLQVGGEVLAEARSVGLDPSLEEVR